MIATVGRHASASNWVFNVAREPLIAAVGEGAVTGPQTDRVDQLPNAAARAFAQNPAAHPSEHVTIVGQFPMDPVTRILGPRIGDGRIGKWRDLPMPLQSELVRIFTAFPHRYGRSNAGTRYASPILPPVSSAAAMTSRTI